MMQIFDVRVVLEINVSEGRSLAANYRFKFSLQGKAD